MTVERTEELCVGPRKEGNEGDMKRPLTFTALSTIAVQSGQTQIVVSILKSGSSVHLKLVHVEPGLSEIGSDQEENHTLIQEQKHLLEKLKKHEGEVLSSVDKKRAEQRRQQKDDWLCEQKSPQEDQEGVYRAMESSLREGWTLLLRLLDRRLHTLRLTADFYNTVEEFALGIERLEDLEIKPSRLNDAQLTYISIRRDILGKSLQLLGISSDLMRKLRELQKTEALQRQGEVLQEEEDEDEEQENSQCSWGTVLRLERVVEALQDRRRAVDLEVKLQIEQAQNYTQTCVSEQGSVERQEWSLEDILAQNMFFTPEAEKLEEIGKSPELPPLFQFADDNKFTSNSSLVFMPSNETLNLQTECKLAEEQQLRVESRTEDRETKTTYGFEKTQKTSRKSLESLSGDNEASTKDLELDEFMNFEAEPEIELQFLKSESVKLCAQSSSHIDVLSEIKLDEQAEDVPTEKESDEILRVSSPSPYVRNKKSDTKLDSHPGSLPIFNLASLQLQSNLGETDSLATPKLKQKLEDNCSIEISLLDCAKDSTLQELQVDENKKMQLDQNDEKSKKIYTKFHSLFPDSKALHIESSLNEIEEFHINANTDKEAVTKIKQSLNENLKTTTASKPGSLEKLEHHSRSLPIFNLVPKKLQPKLQETKDLLNIITDETSRFEEKPDSQPLEISNIQFEINSQCHSYTKIQKTSVAFVAEEVENSQNLEQENEPDFKDSPKIKEIKELYISTCLNDLTDLHIISDQETKASIASLKSELTPVDQSISEQDAPVKKSESFSERFKRLQSKWQEKDDVMLEPQIKPYKVKNQNFAACSKEFLNEVSISDQIKDTIEVQYNAEDNTVIPCEELLEADLVHKTEDKPSVETIVKVEKSTTEKDELSFDHSTSELKQEEARNLYLEEIENLRTSCDRLADKVCVWLDHVMCELSVSSNAGHCLSEAQHNLNINIQLQSKAQAAGEDAESMVHILDQLQTLCPDSSGDTSVSSLSGLTHQLQRSSTEAYSGGCVLNPELTARVQAIMERLKTVTSTIQSNVQRLQLYISFLHTAEEVKVEFENLQQAYSKKPEMEETVEEARWQIAQQKFLMAQEIRNDFKVIKAGLHLESTVHLVMETMEHLNETKEEVEELHKHYQIQMQKLRDNKEYCMKYRERLEKTVKDLQCVSELLDSCTAIDLGSEQHTARLLQQFTLARPHFTQLDAEANFITYNFETLRRLQKSHGLLITENVAEEDVSALLDLHLRLKQKIEESESILELSSSFLLMIKQLENLLQTKPITSGQGRCAEEKLNLLKVEKEQIHNLFNRASNLKMDICDGVKNSSVSGLRVQQLEASLQSVDSQLVSWLHEAAQCEEKVLREMKTQALLHDIHLLRDSFKDLKKRFSNLKINYLKRNERSRNLKAVRNQLQQVDSYEDKLQSLKCRLQALTARLQSEVKDGGSARELEDLLNELSRQMGECERSIREHHKTLDMTCSLQEAMDEYQLWCEEASGTIARVGKFSTECRSTEAVAVLYRQFEKFVWPTVPQQEERISQITELAVRLHGADEGQRYIEKTVSKHSDMVTAIRALSDGLLELEAKLKQQKDKVHVTTDEGRKEKSRKEKDTGNSMNEMKNEEKSKEKEKEDNRTAQEAAEMYELKETGHTPELTNKHDGKDIPVRRHSFSKKPPLHRNRTQETDRQASSLFCSTHTLSLSCSPLETNRQVYAIVAQSQPAMPQATSTQALSSTREVHKAKSEDTQNTPQDTVAGSLYETELHHQHEVLSEDSLSTDEYECPSPDDISLPPLAETPESILVQSDVEEGMCFGSQHSYRSHVQSEHRESSESNQHGVSRFRTESGTFVPSPLTMPIPTQVQAEFTAVHTTTITPEQSNHDNIPDQPPRNTEPIPPIHIHKDMNPSLNVNFPTSVANFSEELPHLRLDNGSPKSIAVCQSSIHEEFTSLEVTNLSSNENGSGNCETSLEDIVADIRLPKSRVPSFTPCNNPTTSFHNNQPHKDFSNALERNPTSTNSVTKKADNELFQSSVNCQQNFSKSDQGPTSTKEEQAETLIMMAACNSLTTTIIKETIYAQSSMSSRSLVQAVSNTATEIDNLDTVNPLHQDKTEDEKSTGTSDQDPPSQDNTLQKPSKVCEDEIAMQNKACKESPGSNILNYNGNPPHKLCGSSTKESDSINNLNPSCNVTSSANKTINIKQNHQTVYHKTSTEQCVHDSGFSAQPGPPPLPEAHTQALVQQANTHVTLPYTSPQLLTPDQDPDICQPSTIREEIRLTPQIKGPSIPPQAQEECSCFTRPVSKAAVVGGSPVTLEVEVTGQPEPTLTWCKDDIQEEEKVRVENQRYEEGNATDGAVCEAWLAAAGTKDHKNNSNDEGEDRGLIAEMYDIVMADWQTWFGTLCFLLWLLFLIII